MNYLIFFSKGDVLNKLSKVDIEKQKIYNLALLAFLDALGYSKRVVRSNHNQLFDKVLNRYIETIKSFLKNKYFDGEIGNVGVLTSSNALNIKLENNSIDGIITSPPYSFAIDYVENDKDQLEYLGYDTGELKNKLIGLKGKGKREKLEIYFKDMEKFFK